MAAGETVFTFASASRIVLERGRAQVSRLAVYRDGALVAPTPTGSSYELVSPAGVVVANPTVSVAAGIAQVTIPSLSLPTTLPYGEGYSERWVLVLESVPRTFRRMAVMGRFELHPPVAETELTLGEYPDLVSSLGDYGQSLQTFMDAAWNELLRHLARYGTYAHIVVEPTDVFDYYRHLVFERVFRALLKFQDSERWRNLWEFHREEMKAARDGLRIQVDRDVDAMADSLGPDPVLRSIHPNLAPFRRMATPWRW